MYRKFTADYLFNGYEILPEGTVLITDSEGIIQDIATVADAGENVQELPGLLCPGFINAHCHLELSHMKGHIPEKTGLTDFILKVVFERNFDEEKILAAIENAENKMLQNGIVAVGDICNNLLTISQKNKKQLQYYNFIEASGFTNEVAEARFQRSHDFYEEYRAAFSASSIVPHAPYSVSPLLFEMIDQFPANNVVTIHNQETAAENELFEMKQGDFLQMYQRMNIDSTAFKPSGKSSLQTYLPLLNHYQSLILVHNVCTSAADIGFQQQYNLSLKKEDYTAPSTHYCLCPNANLYITGKLPDVELLMAKDCSIVLGTDSLASNKQLSILEEMKTLQQHFPAVSLTEMLQWATANGAKALQMSDRLGSFQKGKQPGLVQVSNLDGLKLTAASTSKRIL